jgi:hypothetical protein
MPKAKLERRIQNGSEEQLVRYFLDRWIGKNRRSNVNDSKETFRHSKKPKGDHQKGFGFSE